MDARRRSGGGGLEKWGSVSGPLFCVRPDVSPPPPLQSNFLPALDDIRCTRLLCRLFSFVRGSELHGGGGSTG